MILIKFSNSNTGKFNRSIESIGGYSTRRTRRTRRPAAGLPLILLDLVHHLRNGETREALGVITDHRWGECLRDIDGRGEAELLELTSLLGDIGDFRLHLVLELIGIDENSIPWVEDLARLGIPNKKTGDRNSLGVKNLN
jgi:hypothetical protein